MWVYESCRCLFELGGVTGLGESFRHCAEKLAESVSLRVEAMEHFESRAEPQEHMLGAAQNHKVRTAFKNLLQPNGD